MNLDVYPDNLYQVQQFGKFGYIVSDLNFDFNNEGVCISSEYCLSVIRFILPYTVHIFNEHET